MSDMALATIFSVGIPGCMVWIVLAVWMYLIFHWVVMGELDTGIGIIGLAVSVTTGFVAFKPPFPGFSLIALLVAGGSLLMVPVGRLLMNRAAQAAADHELIEGGYAMLGTNPRHVGGRLRIAKGLYAMGYADRAAALGEAALAGQNEAILREEFMMLRHWRAHAGPNPPGPVACARCDHLNGPTEVFCQGCGGPIWIDYSKGRGVEPRLKRRLFGVWLGATIGILAIPYAMTLPTGPAIAAIVGVLGLVFFIAWWSFRGGGES